MIFSTATIILTFVIIFIAVVTKNNWLIVSYYLAAAILLGNVNKDYWLFFEPADWVALLAFIYIIIISYKSLNNFSKTYVNRFYLLFFLFILLIPFVFNYLLYEVNLTFTYFIIIRAWLASYIFYKIFLIEKQKHSITVIYNKFLKIVFYLAIISAVISIIRYFNTPLRSVLEVSYPAGNDPLEKYGRLIGTMGGTNTAGNFFALITLLSMYSYLNIKNRLSFLTLLISSFGLILTMSFSSIFAFLVMTILLLRKTVKPIYVIISISIIFFSAFILSQVEIFEHFFRQRIETTFTAPEKSQYSSLIPLNLLARLDYGLQYFSILLDNGRIFFGWGPETLWSINFENLGYRSFYGYYHSTLNPYSENFYWFILNQSGLIGLIFFIYLFIKLFVKSSHINPKYDSKFFIQSTLGLILFAAIGNNTLYYGSITELFGISMAFLQISLNDELVYE